MSCYFNVEYIPDVFILTWKVCISIRIVQVVLQYAWYLEWFTLFLKSCQFSQLGEHQGAIAQWRSYKVTSNFTLTIRR